MMNNCRGSTSQETNNIKKQHPSFQDQDADMLMRPSFIKIIHSYNIENQKLRIPEKFVRKYMPDFSIDLAILTVPSGSVWSVGIKSNSDGVWFENGLKKFFEFFSILPGHLLMFRYDGNSQFHVVIFDTSASEIDYPFNNNTNDDNSEVCEDNESPSEEADMSWEEDQRDDEDYHSQSADVSSPSSISF